ncbi:hypothetical protein NDU88_004216 [Pleurodeles waltl]|uniref:Uncharacterized protein n=1 Tax=Pleurodeles waltl TaxID=8319 RepID=A0AAV7RIX1_PLEWA|nr:hypothetical protein NDU88_004216 [Pleurodeles waltl]
MATIPNPGAGSPAVTKFFLFRHEGNEKSQYPARGAWPAADEAARQARRSGDLERGPPNPEVIETQNRTSDGASSIRRLAAYLGALSEGIERQQGEIQSLKIAAERKQNGGSDSALKRSGALPAGEREDASETAVTVSGGSDQDSGWDTP